MTCYTDGRDRNLPVIVWIRGTKVNSYSTYYTASIWFTVFAMVIMLVAVGINPAMDESRRRVTQKSDAPVVRHDHSVVSV